MGSTLRARLRGEEGISLVEIMVGVVIAGMALTAFAGTLTQALSNITRDEQHVRGNQCGAELLEGLRAIPYDRVGFYSSDSGYVASAGGDATVTLGSSRGGDTVAPLPTRVVPCDGTNYTVTLDIVWKDDPQRPAPPAVDPDPNDYKEIRARLDWTVQGRAFSTTQVMVRQPTLEEVPRSNDDPGTAPPACTPGSITRFDVSPAFVEISPSGTTVDAITVAVETCSRSSVVRLQPSPLAERSMVAVPDSNGTRWRIDDFPAGTTDFSPGTYTWTVTATGTAGSDVRTTTVQFAQVSTAQLAVAEFTRSPSSPICTASNGNTHAGTTLTARITGAASSDRVTFSWTANTGSVTGTYVAPAAAGGATWRGVLPAGHRLRSSTTTITVSVTRISDGLQVSESYVVPVARSNNPSGCPA